MVRHFSEKKRPNKIPNSRFFILIKSISGAGAPGCTWTAVAVTFNTVTRTPKRQCSAMLRATLQHPRARRLAGAGARPLLSHWGTSDAGSETTDGQVNSYTRATLRRRAVAAASFRAIAAPANLHTAVVLREAVHHGFAASALHVGRRFSAASGSPPPATKASEYSDTDSKDASAGVAAKPAKSGDDAEKPLSNDADDKGITVDLHAMDRAKVEIDRMQRERHGRPQLYSLSLGNWVSLLFAARDNRLTVKLNTVLRCGPGVRQLKEATTRLSRAYDAWEYMVAMWPWAVSLTKMSGAEWRVAIGTGWGHFKEELGHYWMGTKLLWVEVKIASRLLFKTTRGEALTRRERKQMTRTTADVFRLVPFAFFIVIPFMEFMLPVALKLFPNMLPTTFRNELKHEEELKKKLKAKMEVARFLQDTVKVMAKGLKQSRSGYTREKADHLYDFMKKVRSGAQVTNNDITRYAKLFNDEFTLDHISRAQLVNMCKFVALPPYGTDTFLRYQLREKLRSIKQDDRLIKQEGVSNLDIQELRGEARRRGMRAGTRECCLLRRRQAS